MISGCECFVIIELGLYGPLFLSWSDLWSLNDHFFGHFVAVLVSLFFLLNNIEGNKRWKINFLLLLFLARFAFHRRPTTCYLRATTTSWCWQTSKATWQCLCHRSSSLNMPIKSSQAAGIQQISPSCQRRRTKRQNCGRCRPSKKIDAIYKLFLSRKSQIFLLFFHTGNWIKNLL
jgi:hypothetical protein